MAGFFMVSPQASGQFFAAAMGGVAALSSAAAAQANPAAASSYAPKVGPALNIEAGYHLTDWFSVQAGYIWNQNPIESAELSAASFRQISREEQQHSMGADLMVFFRPRNNWVRPYLSAGPAWVRVASENRLGFRVAVGADLMWRRSGWGVRYSFSEMMTSNPFASALHPPASGGLMNFQNLFGVVKTF